MKYYVLVYDRASGELTSVDEFLDGGQALGRRMELERLNQRGADTEIVILVARSLDSLHRTHARYFQSRRELLENASRIEVMS
jgi:hypothetical protein